METLINALREILGTPDFYVESGSSYSSNYWDYGAMLEYCIAACLLLVVVISAFKFIRKLCE